MNALTRDPLLAAAKGILLFLMGSLGLAIVACAVGIPTVLLAHGYVAKALADAFPAADPWSVIGAIVLILVFAIALLLLVFFALRLLKQIVDTVGQGDPFVPANARRLTTMAWLSLAVQVVTLPIGAIGVWLSQFDGPHHRHIQFEGGISGNGLLLMLILFVLARVFRQGTAMREELDGTV